MSFIGVPRKLIHDARLSVQAKILYMLLLEKAQEADMQTVPAEELEEIARIIGISIQTLLTRPCKELEQTGYIKKNTKTGCIELQV